MAAQHIGIVACSAEGAALCYRTICAEAPQLMGAHNHPEITMHTHSLAEYMRFVQANDWEGVARLMISSATKVAGAGARFAVCPDNTIHQAYASVRDASPIPWLHIAREVGAEARRRGFKRLGVLGTSYLMEGPVYPESLREFGIEREIPDREARQRVNTIIFDELVNAVYTDEARRYFNEVISELKRAGCDAVVLGCTEIPLIVRPEESPLPTLDSTRLLARAALRRALAEEA